MPRPRGDLPAHGTRRRYQCRWAPCRCAECRRANAVEVAAYRALSVARAHGWVQLELPDELQLDTYTRS